MAQDLVEGGTPRECIAYLNFEDDRLIGIKAEELRMIADVQLEMYPMAAKRLRYMFLDEVQAVRGWEKFARRMIETEGVRVCFSGSSARMLSTDIATEMRGRSLSVEVSPFSFAEYVRHVGEDHSKSHSSRGRALLRRLCGQYLASGGFPESIGLEESLRVQLLQEYVGVAVQRDIVERNAIHNAEPLRWLVRTILSNASGLFSVNKMYNAMKSQGRAVSKDSLYAFIHHLRDAFLLFPVELLSDSANTRAANPKKMYAVDHGLLSVFSWKHALSSGAVLENAVYCQLRRRYDGIYYYRTSSGGEVDFVCHDPAGRTDLIQVCADPTAETTSRREIDALSQAMAELNVRSGTVVTLHDERVIEISGRHVQMVPAWRWLRL